MGTEFVCGLDAALLGASCLLRLGGGAKPAKEAFVELGASPNFSAEPRRTLTLPGIQRAQVVHALRYHGGEAAP